MLTQSRLFLAVAIGAGVLAGCRASNSNLVPLTAAAPQSISNIQRLMSRTYTCSGTPCATGNIASPQPAQFYTVFSGVQWPSLSGSSTKLTLYPQVGEPGDVLYFTPSLGEFPSATNFVWDFWFMIDQSIWDSSANGGTGKPLGLQALEFDFNDDMPGEPGYGYNFSSQCYMQLQTAGGPQWQIWGAKTDGNIGWIDSGMTCNPAEFTPMVWHHIIWTYRIHPDTRQTEYLTLTIDNDPPMRPAPLLNPVVPLKKQARPALEVQFQQDARGVATPAPFTEWVDNVTLTFW